MHYRFIAQFLTNVKSLGLCSSKLLGLVLGETASKPEKCYSENSNCASENRVLATVYQSSDK